MKQKIPFYILFPAACLLFNYFVLDGYVSYDLLG